MTTNELTEGIDNSGNFHKFVDEIFYLDFYEKPNYK